MFTVRTHTFTHQIEINSCINFILNFLFLLLHAHTYAIVYFVERRRKTIGRWDSSLLLFRHLPTKRVVWRIFFARYHGMRADAMCWYVVVSLKVLTFSFLHSRCYRLSFNYIFLSLSTSFFHFYTFIFNSITRVIKKKWKSLWWFCILLIFGRNEAQQKQIFAAWSRQ